MAWPRSARLLAAAAGVLGLLGALGVCVSDTMPQSVETTLVPIAGDKIKPPECVGAVAVVCGDMISLAFGLISGQFPGSQYIGPRVITVLPDGRLRYVERISDDHRNPDLDLENFGDGMRSSKWTELPDSQPLSQRWEQRMGVATPLVLTAEFSYGPPMGPQQYEKMTIIGTIETLEPVVPPRQR